MKSLGKCLFTSTRVYFFQSREEENGDKLKNLRKHTFLTLSPPKWYNYPSLGRKLIRTAGNALKSNPMIFLVS